MPTLREEHCLVEYEGTLARLLIAMHGGAERSTSGRGEARRGACVRGRLLLGVWALPVRVVLLRPSRTDWPGFLPSFLRLILTYRYPATHYHRSLSSPCLSSPLTSPSAHSFCRSASSQTSQGSIRRQTDRQPVTAGLCRFRYDHLELDGAQHSCRGGEWGNKGESTHRGAARYWPAVRGMYHLA
jgi:hypothetical protein